MWRQTKFKLNIPQKKLYQVVTRKNTELGGHIVITSPKLLEIAKALKKNLETLKLTNKLIVSEKENLVSEKEHLLIEIEKLKEKHTQSIEKMKNLVPKDKKSPKEETSSIGNFAIPTYDEVFVETKECLLDDEGQPGDSYQAS